MLPKANRIKKKKDFEIIFKDSKGFKNSILIFRVRKNNLGLNRFGFVVSQKVSKRAVIRNKVRRRLSDIAKAEMGIIKAGIDIVMIALPGIEKKEFGEIKEIIKESLSKMGLINKNKPINV